MPFLKPSLSSSHSSVFSPSFPPSLPSPWLPSAPRHSFSSSILFFETLVLCFDVSRRFLILDLWFIYLFFWLFFIDVFWFCRFGMEMASPLALRAYNLSYFHGFSFIWVNFKFVSQDSRSFVLVRDLCHGFHLLQGSHFRLLSYHYNFLIRFFFWCISMFFWFLIIIIIFCLIKMILDSCFLDVSSFLQVLDGNGFSFCFEDIYPFLFSWLFIHLNRFLVCCAFFFMVLCSSFILLRNHWLLLKKNMVFDIINHCDFLLFCYQGCFSLYLNDVSCFYMHCFVWSMSFVGFFDIRIARKVVFIRSKESLVFRTRKECDCQNNFFPCDFFLFCCYLFVSLTNMVRYLVLEGMWWL